MPRVTPRWGWRSFRRRFGETEARLEKLAPASVQASDELFLLSGSGDNVKIRDGLIDINVCPGNSLYVRYALANY